MSRLDQHVAAVQNKLALEKFLQALLWTLFAFAAAVTADILISKAELAERRAALEKRGGYKYPASQTPWQEIQRSMVDQLDEGMVLKPAVKYQKVAQLSGVPRDNH